MIVKLNDNLIYIRQSQISILDIEHYYDMDWFETGWLIRRWDRKVNPKIKSLLFDIFIVSLGSTSVMKYDNDLFPSW